MDTNPANSNITVVIIEDRHELREGLAILINGTKGFQCVGSYASMEEALVKIDQNLPTIVLLDLGLPGINGIEGTKILKERYPQIIILILTIYDDDEKIFNAICAGAAGYLLKKTPPAKLMESIAETVNGGAAMSPEVARRVILFFRDLNPPKQVDYHLSPHETRLLRMFVEGHNYKTAAVELDVTVNTISFHVKNIYEKLQVHSKSEAVAKALRNRLV